jgi:hypothetical protein
LLVWRRRRGGHERRVLPDGPATRGAATSLRAEAFGWALPLVAKEFCSRPTGGPREAVKRRVNARSTRSGYFRLERGSILSYA